MVLNEQRTLHRCELVAVRTLANVIARTEPRATSSNVLCTLNNIYLLAAAAICRMREIFS